MTREERISQGTYYKWENEKINSHRVTKHVHANLMHDGGVKIQYS